MTHRLEWNRGRPDWTSLPNVSAREAIPAIKKTQLVTPPPIPAPGRATATESEKLTSTGALGRFLRSRLTVIGLVVAIPAAIGVLITVAGCGQGQTATETHVPTIATPVLVSTIPVGYNPLDVAISPEGRHVYVANARSDTVSVIDTGSGTVTTNIPAGNVPERVAVSPDGHIAYVTNKITAFAGAVQIVDIASNTVTATIPVGAYPRGVAVTPDGHRVYVANNDSNTVSVIDTDRGTVTATIPVGIHPERVAVHPDGRRVYVTNIGSNAVSVIDTGSATGTAPIAVGV
jgi:YVTN family beta-propeller protein